jgi:site-specific recombinase XerD
MNIANVKTRDALPARREPHWSRVAEGQYLGFRKMAAGSAGTWVARRRDPDTGKQQHKALGDFEELAAHERFDAARRAADAWFTHLGAGGTTKATTVAEACKAYEQHVRDTRGDAPADDMKGRFRRWVDTDKIGAVDLQRLTRAHVEAWRKALAKLPAKINRDDREVPLTRPRSPASLNRDMAALRAALNYAHDMGHTTTDAAWRVALRPVEAAGGRRTLYLDRQQRKALIEHAAPDIGDFLRALALLPLRPGALAALTAGAFDKRASVVTVAGDKAGAHRALKLPPATAAFFAERAANKLPSAPLLSRADGKAWDKDAWKGPVKAAVTAAKLPEGVTAYTLRHSTITDLVTAGLDVLTVAQLSGTSVVMIQKHYGHLRADHAAQALAGLAL